MVSWPHGHLLVVRRGLKNEARFCKRLAAQKRIKNAAWNSRPGSMKTLLCCLRQRPAQTRNTSTGVNHFHSRILPFVLLNWGHRASYCRTSRCTCEDYIQRYTSIDCSRITVAVWEKGRTWEARGRRERVKGKGGNGSCMCKYVCVGYGKVIERSRYDRKKSRVRNTR
jgi:hypothetical protein